MSVFALRQFIAHGVGATVSLDRIISERRDRYVLSYHRILTAYQAENDGVHHSLWITPERFLSQIKWMRSIGEIVDYSRIVDTATPNEQPLFTITFDDGWRDCYEYAFPILKEYQVPSLFFLTTDAICSGDLYWPQDIATKTHRAYKKGFCSATQILAALSESWPEKMRGQNVKNICLMEMLERWIESLKLICDEERQQLTYDYFKHIQVSTSPLTGYIMSWNEARIMHKHGVMFGSHTHNHTILENLPSEQIEFELTKSKELILEKLQIEVNSFCYPNGRYSGEEGAILSRCGYLYGFRLDNMSLRQCNDNFYIPRFIVSERNTFCQDYFKLCLLEVPFYRSKPHKSNAD